MKISIIVPARDAAAFLDDCLGALGRARSHVEDVRDGESECELIVVDDGSSDDTAEIARVHGARVFSRDAAGGPAVARNIGALEADGDLLLFIDADVRVHYDVIARVSDRFDDDPGLTAVIGSYDEDPEDDAFVSTYRNLLHHYVHHRASRVAHTFWAACGAIRRQAFLAVGGFNEGYRRPCIEDIELGYRLSAAGHRLLLDRSIQVTHLKRWTLREMVRTDLLDRAVPWSRLMLHRRRFPADLNVGHAQRISVAAVWGALAALLVAATGVGHGPFLGLVALGLLAATVTVNAPLLRFFADRIDWTFALATVPPILLYYFYCGLGVVWVLATPWRRPPPPQEPLIDPVEEADFSADPA